MNNKIEYKNAELINSFSKEEKEDLFNNISNMYFKKNFGSISKADLETYLFSVYIEHLLDSGEEIDDYTIGRDLGLTISRVRSLKERKELKYPRSNYDWRDSFLKYAENAKYDDATKLIKFQIPDVNVIKDARYFFEKNNEYDEYQLNPKLFQCTLESFQKMGEMIAKEKGEKREFKVNDEKINKILEENNCTEKEASAIRRILSGAAEDGLKEILVCGAKEIMLEVLSAFTPIGIAGKIINIMIKAMKN